MSYARSIVAMSRGALAPAAPDESPKEHVEHVEAGAPAVIAARAPNATATTAALGSSRPEQRRDEPAIGSMPSQVIEHRETLLERVREVPGRAAAESPTSTVTLHTIERERVVTPAPPAWLAEDPSAPDPLVASADTDALRDLLRSVRQWTSSEPTILAPETVVERDTQGSFAPPEPVQVSIGNVVITVEDAPAPSPRGAPRAAPTGASSDRLARNHIRGR